MKVSGTPALRSIDYRPSEISGLATPFNPIMSCQVLCLYLVVLLYVGLTKDQHYTQQDINKMAGWSDYGSPVEVGRPPAFY
jgi:hypothetical protein